MEKTSKIYVAGHRGLAGSAFVRRLEAEGYNNIITGCHKYVPFARFADWRQSWVSQTEIIVDMTSAMLFF